MELVMEPVEIVRRAIVFGKPPRLPFWQHWNHKMPGIPDDVHNIWEMDRAEAGWFFDSPGMDDWGCGWHTTDLKNIGQVDNCPLSDWSLLENYQTPNPRNAFYYERLGPMIDEAAGRYVCLTAHSLLFSRLHKLRGFVNTMQDFHLEPDLAHRLLDKIVDFKLEQIVELHRRFGNRIHGLFVTDDWGTQGGTFVGKKILDEFFTPRYRLILDAIHDCGWHVFLHSCGRINDFVPTFIELGMDVLNMQQTLSYGLEEFGQQFRGKVCFAATVDIQSTMPGGNEQAVRGEVERLVENWSTPQGGIIVFDYGDWEAIGVQLDTVNIMFDQFAKLAEFWQAENQK